MEPLTQEERSNAEIKIATALQGTYGDLWFCDANENRGNHQSIVFKNPKTECL